MFLVLWALSMAFFRISMAILSIVWEVKRLGIRNLESFLRLLYRAEAVVNEGCLLVLLHLVTINRFSCFLRFLTPAGVSFRQNIMCLQTSRDAPYQKKLLRSFSRGASSGVVWMWCSGSYHRSPASLDNPYLRFGILCRSEVRPAIFCYTKPC